MIQCILAYPIQHMMTSSNRNIYHVMALCAGNSSVTGEFPPQNPVTRSFDDFFDLRLNKRWSEQSRRRWLETPSHYGVSVMNDDQDKRSINVLLVLNILSYIPFLQIASENIVWLSGVMMTLEYLSPNKTNFETLFVNPDVTLAPQIARL